MDFNADGRTDFFTATFDGSPHVAYGTEDGFAEPVRILDANGERVTLDQFWNYDSKKWDNRGTGDGHCTSAVAFDWDADGDFDLLLGDHDDGNLYLQRNEGTAEEPEFTGKNEMVLAGGQPFALHGGVSAPRLVDWDDDGLTDLVIGSFGESYTGEVAGGVYWYRNIGKPGAPKFAAAFTLIPPTKTQGHSAERPNVGLYADPVDYDGDGDLDLIVGGYAIWMPKPPDLTEAMEARAKKLDAEFTAAQAAHSKQYQDEMRRIETLDLDEDAKGVKVREFFNSDDQRAMRKKLDELHAELRKLRPERERKAGVWVFLRE